MISPSPSKQQYGVAFNNWNKLMQLLLEIEGSEPPAESNLADHP